MSVTNPVLARELRTRMRGWRAGAVLTIFLSVLALVMVLANQAVARSAEQRSQPLALRLGSLGRASFGWTLAALCLMLVLVVPTITAAAIAGERERQTLVPLQVSRMGPWRILVGKVGASACYTLFLLVAAAPILAIPVLVGGVTSGQVVRAVVAVLVLALLLTVFGVAISALTRRTQSAVLMSYLLVLLLVGGTVLAWGTTQVLAFEPGQSRRASDTILVANPIVGVADFVRGTRTGTVGLDRPVEMLSRSVAYRIEPQTKAQRRAGSRRQPLFGARVGAQSEHWNAPFWAWCLATQIGLALVLMVLAARRLRVPARRVT